MKLQDIISISPEILANILLEETKKIPGISADSIESIKVNDRACSIDISIRPFRLLANNYDIATELQHAINFYLTKQLDIEEGKIKINIFILDYKKEGTK